ncbi:MAG: hypothetical protein ACFB4J_13915 [Elainellaceae cyanobacterium]
MARNPNARNPSSRKTLRPLSVGNIVSSSVQIYRDRLGEYLLQSLFAYLWIFVPIYGWAKYAMICGLMSRRAFQALIGQPETVPQARAKVRSQMWAFLSAGLQIGLRMILIYFGGAIVIAIAGALLIAVFPPAGVVLTVLLVIALIITLIRLYSRWFVVEVPLAVESGLTGTQSINRSWALTKKSVGRVQIVVVIAFLVTLPLVFLTGYLPSFLPLFLPQESILTSIISLISIPVSLIGGALVMPFWQIIKAVVYYDLRSRQEGLDLELRSRQA